MTNDEEHKEQKPYSFEHSENLRPLTQEQKLEYLEKAKGIWKVRLDSYTLPSLIIKVLKNMKKNGVCEIKTTRVEKLRNNFKNDEIGLDQHTQIKEGDEVLIRITLLGSTYPRYFYKLLVKQKLEQILRLKATATNFFKVGNFKKAADLYQKINGYYNFGDSTNNFAKEDEQSPDFIRDNE